MEVLVTGGAGYIGSHTCVELLNKGYDVIVIDNLSNSNPESLKRVQELTGKTLKFYEGDVRDEALLTKIFAENNINDSKNLLNILKIRNQLKCEKDRLYKRVKLAQFSDVKQNCYVFVVDNE